MWFNNDEMITINIIIIDCMLFSNKTINKIIVNGTQKT